MDIYSVAERVINVHTTKQYDYVLNEVFSESICGPRNRTLLWKSVDREKGRSQSIHFFIEFVHKESVAKAQSRAIPGVTVHCLSRNLNMIGIFDCLARGVEPPRKRSTAEAESPAPGHPQDPNRSYDSATGQPSAKRQRVYEHDSASKPSRSPSFRNTHHDSYRQSTPLPYQPRDPPQRNNLSNSSNPKNITWTSTEPRRYQDQNSDIASRKTRFHSNDIQASPRSTSPSRYIQRYHDDHRTEDKYPPYTENDNFSGPSYRRRSDASSISFDRNLAPAGPSSPVQQIKKAPSRLPGLDSMGDGDVAAIVESLITTMSGPEAWMTVAAHYRRKMLHRSALTVVQAMLEVMEKRGMSRSDLRPALLLMAQCHYSIAKQEERENGADRTEESSKYFVTLLEWLRDTYGMNTPAVDAITRAGVSTAESSIHGASWGLERDTKPFLRHEEPSNRSSYLISDPLSTVNGMLWYQTQQSNAAERLEAVTKELDSLRALHKGTMADLASARLAKNESEQALKDEIVKRRKAEQEARDARDGERIERTRALREVDLRKRMEERLVQERQVWDRRAEEMKNDTARSVVQDLTAILTLSARSPLSMLEATRGFCEGRARAERTAAELT